MFKHGSRRAAIAVLAVVFVGTLSACTKNNDGTPTAGQSATSTTATASTPAPSTTSSAPTASTKPSAPAPANVLVLGPTGYGALKLNQSPAQAEATKLITPLSGGTGCDQYAHLLGSPATKADDIPGRLFFSAKYGLVAIYAFPGVKTPEGVQLGTTYARLRQAYPSWKSVDDSSEGRGYVPVPGNSNAVYRIIVHNGKVTELNLQHRQQDCYE